MKHNFLLLAANGLMFVTGYSQNLVNNCSFEQYSACPTNETQINLSVGWADTDADYYNVCAINPSWSVPPAGNGRYQLAATGNAFAGMIAIVDNTGSREVLNSQLSQSLVIGTKYYASIKVNLVLNPPGGLNLASDKLGVKFTMGSAPLINNYAQLFSNTVITDTTNWVTIAGSFIADSAYSSLFVGIFFDTNNVNIIKFAPSGFFNTDRAYYYVDDICVSPDSNAICINQVGFNDNEKEDNLFRIYPNPSGKEARLSYQLKENEKGDLEIMNTLGEIVAEYKLETGIHELVINTRKLENGIYIYRVKENEKVVYTAKMVVIH